MLATTGWLILCMVLAVGVPNRLIVTEDAAPIAGIKA